MKNNIFKKEVSMEIKQRNYMFDNLKGILIFFVVFGHLLQINYNYFISPVYRVIWGAIYLFHMPLFIFVCGYFTKYDINNTNKAIKNYLIPYIVFNFLIYIFDVYVLKNQRTFNLMIPSTAIWFLITIFYYKIIYNGVYKIKGLFILSIIFAIVGGFDESLGVVASLSRTVCFFPFFIAGNKFKEKYLLEVNKYKTVSMLLILIMLVLISYILMIIFNIPITCFTFASSYKIQNLMSLYIGAIIRIVIMSISFGCGYLILNVVPNKKTWLTSIGENTITVYLLHIFIYNTLLKSNNFLREPTIINLLICLILSTFIVFIFSRKVFKKSYNTLINHISKLIGI